MLRFPNMCLSIFYFISCDYSELFTRTWEVGKFGEKTREARLRWYGHLRRKDDGYIGRRMLRMELPGTRKRGRPKRRFMDVVKEDMAEVEVTEEDTVDRRNWRKKIRCGDPWWEKPKEEEFTRTWTKIYGRSVSCEGDSIFYSGISAVKSGSHVLKLYGDWSVL